MDRAGAAKLPGGADDLRHILDGTTIAVLKQIDPMKGIKGKGDPEAVGERPGAGGN